MNLATITMDKTEARKRFLEYRQSVRERHSKEDEQIMRGYREMSRGRQIIDLPAVIRQGGTMIVPPRTKSGSPMWAPSLAVMRADEKWCWVRCSRTGRVEFHSKQWPSGNETRNLIVIPEGTFTPIEGTDNWSGLRSMVPPVPPALRPADKLGNYHVLWEAEWEQVAPVDPVLLKHIGGDLYVVLAQWDLTELERSVLAGRFR